MTLLDLLQLIKRFIKLVVIIPVVCALIALVLMLVMPKDYQAVATITASNEVAAAGGIATTAASEASNNGITVKAATNANAKQITLTAEGHNAQGVQEAANSAAQSAANRAQESFSAQTFKVATASAAKDVSQSPFKTALIALFAALFVVICGIVVWDTVKRPIKNKDNLEEVAQAPVIGQLPTRDHGEKLFANVRFVAKDALNTVCIVPVDDPSASRQVAEEIYGAASMLGINTEMFKADPHAEYLYTDTALADLNLVDCAPLSQGMGAAYLSRNADVVILAVRQWTDSAKEIEAIINEFSIAKVELNGVVMLPEDVLARKKGMENVRLMFPARSSFSHHGRHDGQY